VGRLGSVLFAGLTIEEVVGFGEAEAPAGIDPLGAVLASVYLVAALILLASSRYAQLRSLQPAVLLAMVPVQALSGSGPLVALGFGVVGVYLLERFGYFRSLEAFKTRAILLGLGVSEALSILVAEKPLRMVFPALACCAVVCFVVWIAATSRPHAAAEPRREASSHEGPSRESPSLEGRGLSWREHEFAVAALEGVSMKDIACRFGVKHSTVRNTFAAVYRKLGVAKLSDFMRLYGHPPGA
jgi:DNA-binding CsgD family transcriptional regulator